MTRLLFALFTLFGPPGEQTSHEALRPSGSIAMPGVEGRIDHLSIDLEGNRLFVAALGNNTMEVIDTKQMRSSASVRGLHEPQGIRYLPDRRRVVVANGGDGSAVFFDGASLARLGTGKFSGDADNVRYDPDAHRVYVGYGSGALGILDTDGRILGTLRLGAHPESFQLEASGPRIFINVPSVGHVAVVDRQKGTVTATWPVSGAGANYPMALDETNHRLFLGCRSPARLLVYDTATGRQTTTVDIVGDTDDLFYDAARRRIYVLGGAGAITVIDQQAPDRYRVIETRPTAAGARTGLFVAETGQLFLAVPHRGAQRAEIRVYATVP